MGRIGSPRFLDPNSSGVALGGGIPNRSKFQISNSSWSRPRNLQWRPVRARGPVGLPGPPTLSCHFCKGRGHLDFFCPSKYTSFGSSLTSFPAFGSRAFLVGNQNSPDHSTWFRTPVASLISGPPIFSCFEEFAREVLKNFESTPLQSLTLSLGVTSPKPQPAPSSSASWRSSVPAPMAFRRVDPEPCLPSGFSASVVLHREIMARSVTRCLPPLLEDWAIISIQPLPDHEITFSAVRDVVREYLVEHRRLGVRDIQRSHLGQVLVQFSSVLERDNLVLLGPQQYLDASFTAQRHNDAWNHRALYFNRECWLMLLGFPLDYRSSEYLQAAIGSFGRLILWEEDRRNVYRTLLRVRVTSLEEVPQFIVFSEADGFIGDSWTVQCEIIQQTLLGVSLKIRTRCQWSRRMVSSSLLSFFGLGQLVPAVGWDLIFPPEDNFQAQPADNIQGDWDQWIVNVPPVQQPHLDLPPDEQQISNPYSDLSSDSSSGHIHGALLQNGQIPEDLVAVGPVPNFNAPAPLALGDLPMIGPQEVDGPPIQGVLHVPGDIVIPDAQPAEPNVNGHNNVRLNFMFSQDWQPDPVLLSHLERKRNAQFFRIWANYLAQADSSVTSVQVPKKWASFFLSNLMQEDSFSWSKTFLSSYIPSALLEPETETHPFVIPRKCPDDKFLDSVLSEESADDTSVPSDLASSTPKFVVVESDLRRSKRLRDARAGFRQGSCQKKNCLMCQHKFEGPPSLSAKTIRRLGERFCNLSEEELADKALKKKKNPPGCVGSNKSGKKDKGDKKQDSSDDDN
jgi:hypothetical protein